MRYVLICLQQSLTCFEKQYYPTVLTSHRLKTYCPDPKRIGHLRAGADNTLKTFTYRIKIQTVQVGNGDKPVYQQTLIFANYREELLMILHTGDQGLSRN